MLERLEGTNDGAYSSIREFEKEVSTLRKQLGEKLQMTTLEEFEEKLDELRNNVNLKGLNESIKTLEDNFRESISTIVGEIENKTNELETLSNSSVSRLSETLEGKASALAKEIYDLKNDLGKVVDFNKGELKGVAGSINSAIEAINKQIKTFSTKQELGAITEESKKAVNALTEKIQKDLKKMEVDAIGFRQDFISRLSDVASRGGGGISRQIRVEGSVLSKYNDINFYGTASSVTSSINNTNKQIDIGIPSANLSGYVPYTGATTNLAMGNNGVSALSFTGGSGSDLSLTPDVANGATAVAYTFDTLNTLTTTAQIASFKNNGTVVAGIGIGLQTNPSLFLGDGDTGFYETADDSMGITFGGTKYWEWASGFFRSSNGTQPSILRTTPTATIPVILPNQGDANTGIGSSAADQLSLIAGGVEGARITTEGIIALNLIRKLATVNSVDLKTVAATTLYTVTTGKSCVLTSVVLRSTNGSGWSVGMTVSIGTNATDYNNLVSSGINQNYSKVTGYADIYDFGDYSTSGYIVTSAEVIKLNVTTGATATTDTVSVDIFGYEI